MSEGRPVHLVGSVPLGSTEAVFKAIGETLGDLTRRVPDGETGVRKDWIFWQGEIVSAMPMLDLKGQRKIGEGNAPTFPVLDFKDGTPEHVEFGPLNYAKIAIESYARFRRLRDAGILSPRARFEVCLPTPFAIAKAFFVTGAVRRGWDAYERRMNAEVAQMVSAIPPFDLAIQWDIAIEIAGLERGWLGDVSFDELMTAVARVADPIPETVDVGFHLCYGDVNHKHAVEPKDAGLLARMSNDLARTIKRRISFIHFPVPRDRDDDAYFAPLRGLEISPETELFAGLIHLTDGLPGALNRLKAMQKITDNFGVATECGFGRRPPESVMKLLQLHKDVAHAG